MYHINRLPLIYFLVFFVFCCVYVFVVREKDESMMTIAAIARHVVLPSDEMPTVATIASTEQLTDQAFFMNAKVGDRVLIYTRAQKAILYDPVIDRVIEVSALSLSGAMNN